MGPLGSKVVFGFAGGSKVPSPRMAEYLHKKSVWYSKINDSNLIAIPEYSSACQSNSILSSKTNKAIE